jgi:elongation factor G
MPGTSSDDGKAAGGRGRGPRAAAIVGPAGSGKTTLTEALLAACGAIGRKGRTADGTTVGDASPEARARGITTEVNVSSCGHLGDGWTFLDCPGSVELAHEARAALMVADVAVVVAEPVPERMHQLRPVLKELDDLGVPHLLFLNKVDLLDGTGVQVADLLAAARAASSRPLALRHLPIREEGRLVGYVDLISERAYRYRPGAASDRMELPDAERAGGETARRELLEQLADLDDGLMELLLEDAVPDAAEIYRQLAKDVRDDLIVPVMIGAGERDHGVRRLLKALRHDAPGAEATAARLALDLDGAETAVQSFRTVHAPHAGRLSWVRVWRGGVAEGAPLGGQKAGAVWLPGAGGLEKAAKAEAGRIAAVAKLDGLERGRIATEADVRAPAEWPAPPEPVYRMALSAPNRMDEVKLSGALQKLAEEDPAFACAFDPDTGELVAAGQGEVHLGLAADRLRSRWNLAVTLSPARVPYRETIRSGCARHARFKRQTGGHGQFADVTVEVAPLPRGAGFRFEDRVVGGAVPRGYIPAVEAGARDAMDRGPLGHPVVDVAVTLTGGQHHAVDSSEQAFRTVGRMAVAEALAECGPVLLEPILEVEVLVPSEARARVQRAVSSRRGQILGFDARPGWDGWDAVKALIPQADAQDLIVEVRSLTQGLGTFRSRFHRLAEATGKAAERGLAAAQ